MWEQEFPNKIEERKISGLQTIDEKANLFYRGRTERSPMHDAAIAGQTQSFIDAFIEDNDRNMVTEVNSSSHCFVHILFCVLFQLHWV